nr:dual specificity protein phosphatase family protein [uncultured Desulfobulbus sp.]
MPKYELTWITEHLATGYAPMSYEELDAIREQGISAIVNLCGEFCDLHQIEEQSGFEVYYLPVADECAPDLEEMEKALEWLDEAVYLNKKVLVHCRHGFGRTGTFVSAYLLRRGLGMKMTEKALKGNRAKPTNYSQWKLLRKYGKQEGILQAKKPSIDNQIGIDTQALVNDYITFVAAVDDQYGDLLNGADCCGQGNSSCCFQPFDMLLIESHYLSKMINKSLSQDKRLEVIERAVAMTRKLRELHHESPGLSSEEFQQLSSQSGFRCPLLSDEGACLLYTARPLRCRLFAVNQDAPMADSVQEGLRRLSKNAYLTLAGIFPPGGNLDFSSVDTMSGKFVQVYYQAMMHKR